eukprot:CAMPEP_0115736378 /NCGR_PEP_ID=MMETSP0272-20121206/87226_1 /TAXON_ID=71861 /ORGANISM="Scrippsiella trochoidea, Strain CCMP3099" /LENGTH=344 /DNA_ID=CAMNT_0003180557 /DNA_START=158 /DNA_END=1191 /DNA_ORIENTATION=+
MPEGKDDVVEHAVSPRLLGRGHLEDRAAEAPDVRLAAMADCVGDDLGCHPRHGSDRRERLCAGAVLGAAEIRELDAERRVDQDVCALEISMDHWRGAAVQVVQPLQASLCCRPQQLPVEGAKLAEHAGHGAAGHELQKDVQMVVDAVAAQVADNVGGRRELQMLISTWSRSASFLLTSSWMFASFTAKILPVLRSCALYTHPYEPAPICSPLRQSFVTIRSLPGSSRPATDAESSIDGEGDSTPGELTRGPAASLDLPWRSLLEVRQGRQLLRSPSTWKERSSKAVNHHLADPLPLNAAAATAAAGLVMASLGVEQALPLMLAELHDTVLLLFLRRRSLPACPA